MMRVEENEVAVSTEEHLARARLTIAEVESVVVKLERYLASNGKYLDLSARVPMERTPGVLREALNAWRAAS